MMHLGTLVKLYSSFQVKCLSWDGLIIPATSADIKLSILFTAATQYKPDMVAYDEQKGKKGEAN